MKCNSDIVNLTMLNKLPPITKHSLLLREVHTDLHNGIHTVRCVLVLLMKALNRRIPISVLILPGTADHRNVRHQRRRAVDPKQADGVLHVVLAVHQHRERHGVAVPVQRARQVESLSLSQNGGPELVSFG